MILVWLLVAGLSLCDLVIDPVVAPGMAFIAFVGASVMLIITGLWKRR